MNVLVTGGAGYVGSHTCKELNRSGFTPVVVDNLSRGHKWAVKYGPFYKCDIFNKNKLIEIIKKHKIQAALHFAAYAYVGESVKKPSMYYENNVMGTIELLNALLQTKVRRFVFSSTCATYGMPKSSPITEDTPQNPINPYGRTKLMMEEVLKDFGAAYGIKSVALRYFNAAGADAELEIGEDHDPETHLIPLAIEANLKGKKPITILGTDYPTADGTCIRDYIHVSDLARAHVLALKALAKSNITFEAFNLGTGIGSSVREVIQTIENYTGKKTPVIEGPRRAGDPPILVASGQRALERLAWQPRHNLDYIVQTAVQWHKNHHL